MRALFGGVPTRTSLALALRARLLIEPEKPLPFEVKVPMVAIVGPFSSSGAIAASMAGDRPEAIHPHPQGPPAVKGSQGATSCRREEGRAAAKGRKSQPAVAGKSEAAL